MNELDVTVFSGGTGGNALLGAFDEVPHRRIHYCLPISDNGGSTSEILRVLGGPGIGDLRSRLLRLIPDEEAGIKALLNHRLPNDGVVAKREFLGIVDGEDPHWEDISSEKREVLRSFLGYAANEIFRRSRPGSSFRFTRASIGNLILAGARMFLGSLESAIYLVASVSRCPPNVQVLPMLNTNFTHHIAARLENGEVVVGQHQISHPSLTPWNSDDEVDDVEDANLPGSHPLLRKDNIAIVKSGGGDLPSRISSIYYINPYGQPIQPRANRKVLEAIASSQVIVYCCGSLFTSIIPCLVLGGVGDAIAKSRATKILLLNGSMDRETMNFDALDFINAIAGAASQTSPTMLKPTSLITHVVYLISDGRPYTKDIHVDPAKITALGIDATGVIGKRVEGEMRFSPRMVSRVIKVMLGLESPRIRRSTLTQ